MNVANALQNVANTFKNNFSALESISNGLKYIVMRCQCIFNAFSTYLLCRVFANRVTYYGLRTSELHCACICLYCWSGREGSGAKTTAWLSVVLKEK